MSISESLQWWEESQLRVLVLGSLILQYFLAVAALLRKRRTHPLFRFFTWLAYLGSDATAIYALATLFNRYKKQQWASTNHSSAGLEVLWAPIILMHLGGQDGITAYNIEDNELWRRHVLTALSQVTVAIYVFCKSWTGEKRLLQTAILIFVPGILKCFEKPWALKNASITSLTSSTVSDKEDKIVKIKSLQDYVQETNKYCLQNDEGNEPDEPYSLFVDIVYPYDDRIENLKYMAHHPGEAHKLVKSGLSSTFDRLYTKEQVSKGIKIFMSCTWTAWCGNFLRSVVGYLSFAAIGLFHKSHKEAYSDTDVKVTYTLLCCTAALEYLIVAVKQYIDCFTCIFGLPWPDDVAQYNLLEYLARKRKHTWLGKLLTLRFCEDYVDQVWCMKPFKLSSEITELVHAHVLDGWKDYIEDPDTYSSFNDIRGQWTLEKESCIKKSNSLKKPFDESILVGHLSRPFDESVLIWHLATDICFYSTVKGPPPHDEAILHSRAMSNYMVYLLFINPEMLMTGTRRSLFTTAYDELKHIFMQTDKEEAELKQNGKVRSEETELKQKENKERKLEQEDKIWYEQRNLTNKIIDQLDNQNKGTYSTKITSDAWELAKALMGLGMEKQEKEKGTKMWKVIQGVWVEMLCFSASRCRGYLHAKNMSKGGEYLSYVWLLQSYMGMETLAERLQRTELPEHGDKGATMPAAPTSATGDGNATAPKATAPVTQAVDEIV